MTHYSSPSLTFLSYLIIRCLKTSFSEFVLPGTGISTLLSYWCGRTVPIIDVKESLFSHFFGLMSCFSENFSASIFDTFHLSLLKKLNYIFNNFSPYFCFYNVYTQSQKVSESGEGTLSHSSGWLQLCCPSFVAPVVLLYQHSWIQSTVRYSTWINMILFLTNKYLEDQGTK